MKEAITWLGCTRLNQTFLSVWKSILRLAYRQRADVILSSNLRTILGTLWMDPGFQDASSESSFWLQNLAAEFGYKRRFHSLSSNQSVIKHGQWLLFLLYEKEALEPKHCVQSQLGLYLPLPLSHLTEILPGQWWRSVYWQFAALVKNLFEHPTAHFLLPVTVVCPWR